MALKYREELVGKRFLALRTPSQSSRFCSSDYSKDFLTSESNWIRGIIRGSTDKDSSAKETQVLVEFDGLDWNRRDWLKIHEDFSAFLVEETLILSQRSHPEKPGKKCWWPALTFKSIVDGVGIKRIERQPIEYLTDQCLSFVTADNKLEYKEGSLRLDNECKAAAKQWSVYQDGQRILVSTPTVLVGFRVKVYRTEGTTQWFTAVIQHYNENNKELSLLDDTVLEERYESAELTQIIPLDGVVEEILKGTEARITHRRRACKEKEKDKDQGKDKESSSQSTQVNSGSNQANSSRSKQAVSQSSSQSSSGNGQPRSGASLRASSNSSSSGNTNTGNKPAAATRKSAAVTEANNSKSTVSSLSSKQTASVLNKETLSVSQPVDRELTQSSSSAEAVRAHTSVIKRAPKAEKRTRKPTGESGEEDKKKERQPAHKKRSTSRKSTASEPVNTSSTDTEILKSDNVITSQSPPAVSSQSNSEPDNISDMHIKKQRALGAISESNSSVLPNTNLLSSAQSTVVPPPVERTLSVDRSSADSVIVSAGSSNILPPPASLPLQQSNTTPTNPQSHRIDKLSECSTDGSSSGYNSAATNDSTISPRDKDGHKIVPHPGLIAAPPTSNPSPTSALAAATTPVLSAHPSAAHLLKNQTIPSSHTAKPKSNHHIQQEQNHTPHVSSPLVVETNKEASHPPVVPYRDPELLKRDAEVRKMAQPPSGPPQPNLPPTSRSLTAGNAGLSAAMPGAAANAAAAMLNPQLAAQQHFNIQQLTQQYQLMEQYRQLQAQATMPGLNPLQQIQLLQQQQLAVAQATQQQMALELLYNRQIRPPGLPNSTPNWMMMPPFGDNKPLLSDLQREHELRALDQKESVAAFYHRAEREAREKQEKERAEKERIEKEKEHRQLIERQERARVLKESAQLAQDAVNQHFHESIRRMHTTTTPPINPNAAAMAMWGKKGGFNMAAGDSIQPQDLSLNNKTKQDHQRLEAARQEREIEQHKYQAQILAAHGVSLSDDKQKAINRQHEAFMRSIQTGSSGQQPQQQSSEAKLVEEHFMKAGLSRLPPKSEQAPAYSLYGYQPFQRNYVSKDQLQQQLIKEEKLSVMDTKSPKSLPTSQEAVSKSSSQTTQSRPSVTPSHQLIQEGLIPNPAYTPHASTSATSTSNTSSSISALMNMSNIYAASQADRYNREKAQTVKSEPSAPSSVLPTRTNPLLPGAASTSMEPGEQASLMNMNSFKSIVEHAVTQAFLKDVEAQEKKSRPQPSPPATSTQSVKSEKVNGTMDTDSDTLSAPSPTLSIKAESQDATPCHPKMKLKKEWKQMQEGGGATSSSPTSVTGSVLNNSNTSQHSETTTSASETENEHQSSSKHKAKKRKSDTSSSTANGQQKKAKNSDVSSGHYSNTLSRSSGPYHHAAAASGSTGAMWPAAGGDALPMKSSYHDEQDSIKQLAEIALRADSMEAIPYANKPLVRVNIATLKKTLQPFVQDGSCIEMAPKLSKCRECKMTPNQRNKKMPNIFCRFYAFRMLRFRQNGQICIAGFCDPNEAEPDDITIWLPHLKDRKITEMDMKTAKYIISNVGEEFCRLVEQEQECFSWSDNKRAWKRAVQGVREMCDVCDTTLFNTHWVCHRCGFVVCIDCYRVKRKIQSCTVSNDVCEENRRWLSCTTNKNHEADKLMLTSIIPADALRIARDLIHHVRRKHNIDVSCMCSQEKLMSPNQPATTNGQHSTDGNRATSPVNGQCSSSESKLSQSFPQDVYRQTTLLSSSLDTKTLNTYSDDPLSLLADVASMAPSTNGPGLLSEVKLNGSTNGEEMDTDTGEKKPCITLRKLLTKSQANGVVSSDKKIHDMVNTVVDPAIPPVTNSNTSNSMLSPSDFAYYKRRSGAYLKGRSHQIPTSYLKETSMLYPDVKHNWLCDGKLLRLLDPIHPSNYKMFNQRWKQGQPIIVSNVSKQMKVNELWSPEAFSREFGHVRHDLIDCRRNEPLTGYQIKCFWDGFEDASKRLTDATGQPLILKLKDWPSSEDFADSMPSRFLDLMSALPMPSYTQRNGELNLAGRLPEFFVKPDLGPKMYIAYGLAKYPQSGTTNLHLDVSDAVNVMVFVAKEKELQEDVMKLIEASDCDELSKSRVTENGETPGALWHIYDAQDADKMRDLLNKVALELGMELEPYHDPIHDQQFYLDRKLRQRLAEEYGVYGYPVLQCEGDAVFIPAGAPHQVQNLNGCVKVAEDFVSPEHLHHCFNLTQEFRHLSNTHTNHEDKLQVKNIIYHAIKDAVAVLDQCDPIT